MNKHHIFCDATAKVLLVVYQAFARICHLKGSMTVDCLFAYLAVILQPALEIVAFVVILHRGTVYPTLQSASAVSTLVSATTA